MFKIKNLTVKNFLSVGNVTQAIDFDRYDLTFFENANQSFLVTIEIFKKFNYQIQQF